MDNIKPLVLHHYEVQLIVFLTPFHHELQSISYCDSARQKFGNSNLKQVVLYSFFFFSPLCTHFSLPHVYLYHYIPLYVCQNGACASLWMSILLGTLCIHVTRARKAVNEEGQKKSTTKYVSTEPKRMAVVMWLFALVRLYERQITFQFNIIRYLQKLLFSSGFLIVWGPLFDTISWAAQVFKKTVKETKIMKCYMIVELQCCSTVETHTRVQCW